MGKYVAWPGRKSVYGHAEKLLLIWNGHVGKLNDRKPGSSISNAQQAISISDKCCNQLCVLI